MKYKRNKIRSIVEFLIENIMTISLISWGLFLFYKAQPNLPDTETSLGLIFGLLSTMVISDYITKLKYLRKIDKNILDIKTIVNTNQVFVDNIPIKEELTNCTEFFVLTNTGNKTISAYDDSYEDFLNRGGKLEIILMDPSDGSEALKSAASKSLNTHNFKYFQHKIENTLNEIENLKSKIDNKKTVSIDFIGFAPPYGIYIFNPGHKNARLYIRLFTLFDSLNKSITFKVSKQENPYVYEHFYNQFLLIKNKSYKLKEE